MRDASLGRAGPVVIDTSVVAAYVFREAERVESAEAVCEALARREFVAYAPALM